MLGYLGANLIAAVLTELILAVKRTISIIHYTSYHDTVNRSQFQSISTCSSDAILKAMLGTKIVTDFVRKGQPGHCAVVAAHASVVLRAKRTDPGQTCEVANEKSLQ